MSGRIRILFVDDEPLVLQGLQRSLRSMRDRWDMEFVETGDAALARMAARPCDVLVTDMQMPGMSGADLVERVVTRHPSTLRFVLSGHAERKLMLQCMGNTHQCLSKPCEVDALRTTLIRSTRLFGLLQDPKLVECVTRIDRLPTVPALYREVEACLQSPTCELADVAALMAQDVALTAGVLKLANSAFFGLGRKISDAAQAVAYLGVEVVQAVVLSSHLFEQASGSPQHAFFLEQLRDHSLATARAAATIARGESNDATLASETLSGGMLHDIGQLVLLSAFGSSYLELLQRCRVGDEQQAEEENRFGANHAMIGGYLLALWGLPVAVVESVMFHHAPRQAEGTAFDALTAVHVAELWCAGPGRAPAYDLAYLQDLGLGGRVEAWRHALLALEAAEG